MSDIDPRAQFERFIELTNQMTQLHVRQIKLIPMRRVSMGFNWVALVCFIIAICEDGLTFTWYVGFTAQIIAFGLLGQALWTMRRIDRQSKLVLQEMTKIEQQLAESRRE